MSRRVRATGAAFVLLLAAFSLQATTVIHYNGPLVIVLGIAQDAGYPQFACYKPHCEPGWRIPERRRFATSLALIDRKKTYLFEATPDIREQMYRLQERAPEHEYPLSGVFLTHAHVGHYAGLLHVGHEAAGMQGLPVYAMPRMRAFIERNGPWSQLVEFGNIELRTLTDGQPIPLQDDLSVTPILVPHRDEFSETVGYRLQGPQASLLFIPDIDKWQRWDRSLVDEIRKVDFALLDGTFFRDGELPGRDMSAIPHPFVEETMALLADEPATERAKVCFIHFNHTNPLIAPDSEARRIVADAGFCAAQPGQVFAM